MTAFCIILLLAAGGNDIAHARIQSAEINESSGVVASRAHPGVLWTHNDSGNPPVLFAIDRDGRLLAKYRVDRDNRDWEDIAIDNAGNLYVGEIGNNGGKKDQLAVYRLAEPDPSQPSREKLRVNRTWKLRFAGEPFDSEGLFIWQSEGFIVAKHLDGRAAGVWRFSLDAGEQPQTLSHVCDLPIRAPVTGADLSPDGSRLVVCTPIGVSEFLVDGDIAAAATAPMRSVAHVEPSREAACFVPGGVLTTSEKRDIRFFSDRQFDFAATQPSR